MQQIFQPFWRNEIMMSITAENTYAAVPGEKVFAIPTRVLVELPSYKIVAFGQEARPVEFAGIKQAKVILPCSSIEVFDQTALTVFLRAVMQMLLGKAFLLKPKVYISQSSQITPFMQELWQVCLYQAGAREVISVHPLLAAAAGVGLPVADSHGYALGWWDEDRLVLGLVAFGHVQTEKVFRLPSQITTKKKSTDFSAIARGFGQAWQEFLLGLPDEFRNVVVREGIMLIVNNDHAKLAKALSAASETPVTLIPRSIEVLGLQKWAEA